MFGQVWSGSQKRRLLAELQRAGEQVGFKFSTRAGRANLRAASRPAATRSAAAANKPCSPSWLRSRRSARRDMAFGGRARVISGNLFGLLLIVVIVYGRAPTEKTPLRRRQTSGRRPHPFQVRFRLSQAPTRHVSGSRRDGADSSREIVEPRARNRNLLPPAGRLFVCLFVCLLACLFVTFSRRRHCFEFFLSPN